MGIKKAPNLVMLYVIRLPSLLTISPAGRPNGEIEKVRSYGACNDAHLPWPHPKFHMETSPINTTTTTTTTTISVVSVCSH